MNAEELQSGDDFTGCLMSGRCTKVLVLLDFGLCIDMARFPPDTAFKVEKKRSFPCIEMLTGRPWTYQAGLAITALPSQHLLVSTISSPQSKYQELVSGRTDGLMVFGPVNGEFECFFLWNCWI